MAFATQYHPTKIHAIKKVENPSKIFSSNQQNIIFNEQNRVKEIFEGMYKAEFSYNASAHRQSMKMLTTDDSSVANPAYNLSYTRYYLVNYEKEVRGNTTTEVCYISTSIGLAAAYITQNNASQLYYLHTDHLGSIIGVSNSNQQKIYEVSYDAWGQKRPTEFWFPTAEQETPPSWLWRGYTGHEHIEEFALINMNARLYDPILGRMLSPDNYVSNASNSQDYNRYTYARNNPLKYIDPDGNIVVPIIGALIFTTDFGYELQKHVSPYAVQFSFNWGTHVNSIGVNASFGVPQILPIHYRVNGGLHYRFKYYDNSYSGWEKRYGHEAGATLLCVGFKYSSNNVELRGSEFDQHTNRITIGNPLFNIQYENDFMFGLPADGGDRYRTAAIKINFGFVNLNLNMFTGNPGVKGFDYSEEERERTESSETPYKRVRKRKTDENPYKGYYTNSKYGTDPNRYRAGVLSVGFGPLRIGRDSEKIRHSVQNKFAHDIRWN